MAAFLLFLFAEIPLIWAPSVCQSCIQTLAFVTQATKNKQLLQKAIFAESNQICIKLLNQPLLASCVEKAANREAHIFPPFFGFSTECMGLKNVHVIMSPSNVHKVHHCSPTDITFFLIFVQSFSQLLDSRTFKKVSCNLH